jgi:hypothetical protein
VARSRHNNGVERNRGADPYGILIQPEPLDEKICTNLGGEWLRIGKMRGCGSWGDQSAPWPSGRSCTGSPGRGAQRRMDRSQGATARRSCGRDDHTPRHASGAGPAADVAAGLAGRHCRRGHRGVVSNIGRMRCAGLPGWADSRLGGWPTAPRRERTRAQAAAGKDRDIVTALPHGGGDQTEQTPSPVLVTVTVDACVPLLWGRFF